MIKPVKGNRMSEAISVDKAFISDLEPVIGELLERHLSKTKEWFPHELVPYGRGRDFEPGEEWDPNEVELDDSVRSALYVNLLTEDNLPYYFRTIESMFGPDNAWGEWNRRWTAEEGRHSIVIRDYLTVTRAIDPVALERARMSQVEKGQVPEPPTVADGIVYVALQELATRISHHNTGKKLKDASEIHGYEVMKRVGVDENFHHLLYRDLGSAALKLDPSAMVVAIERQVREFEMPGTGIIGFGEHAKRIASAGIYDFQVHHDDIIEPVVIKHWKVGELEGLTPEAEAAREKLMKRVGQLGKAAQRLARQRNEQYEQTSS
jgi:acyl-[acyl-carrier-protein] desaturase